MKKLILASLSLFLFFSCSDELSNVPASSDAVLSGSYANMLTLGDYLYMVSESELITYSLLDPTRPVEINRGDLGFGVESMFIRGDVIFIGSRSAMHIYKVGIDGVPFELSTTDYNNFEGFCGNDPIVANDSIAYATLSTTISTACERIDVNELRLYNIEDLSNPVLLNSVFMDSPKGLGLDDEWLFVCEAKDGLKVFDVSNPLSVNQLHHFPGFEAYDVIPNNGLLMLVGPDSLYQFDYSDITEMNALSALEL